MVSRKRRRCPDVILQRRNDARRPEPWSGLTVAVTVRQPTHGQGNFFLRSIYISPWYEWPELLGSENVGVPLYMCALSLETSNRCVQPIETPTCLSGYTSRKSGRLLLFNPKLYYPKELALTYRVELLVLDAGRVVLKPDTDPGHDIP